MVRAAANKLAKGAILGLSALFPRAAEEAVTPIIRRRPSADLLKDALASVPIESITVRGEQGLFEGAASDLAVIQRYALQRSWSPKTLKMLLEFFGPSKTGTYVDIGANIGLTAVPIAAAGVTVLAFEPEPRNFAFLTRNAQVNGAADKLRPLNLALLDRPGDVTFELSPWNHGDHRYRRGNEISAMGEENWPTVTVSAATLDSYADEVEDPVALKIDTQGSEPLVIAGGPRLCERAALAICEFTPYAMRRMNTDPAVLIEYFGGFSRVDIYERESEEVSFSLSGAALRDHLHRYARDHATTPYGSYLNLIGRR